MTDKNTPANDSAEDKEKTLQKNDKSQNTEDVPNAPSAFAEKVKALTPTIDVSQMTEVLLPLAEAGESLTSSIDVSGLSEALLPLAKAGKALSDSIDYTGLASSVRIFAESVKSASPFTWKLSTESSTKVSIDEGLNKVDSCYADEIVKQFEKYLPSNDEAVNTFVKAKCKIIKLAIEHEHYDNAYFNLYFLFMVFVYNCVWKISRSSKYKQRFTETSIFLEAYKGKSQKKTTDVTENDNDNNMINIDFCNVESIFDYSRIPDKNIIKILTLIGFEKSFIQSIDAAINLRNNMAHATNENVIVDKDVFGRYVNDLKNFMKRINEAMKPLIQHWYLNEFLLKILRGEYSETISPDFKVVWETTSSDFSLSQAEVISCGSFGLQNYIKEHKESLSIEEIKLLKSMNKYIREYFAS